MDYQEACQRAATQQGLDPATEALTAAGVPNVTEQTGGMCMVVRVQGEDPGVWIYLTGCECDDCLPHYAANDDDGDGQHAYLVYLYHGPVCDDEGCEGHRLAAHHVDADDLAELCRDALRHGDATCDEVGA